MKKKRARWGFIGLGTLALLCATILSTSFAESFGPDAQIWWTGFLFGGLFTSIAGMVGLGWYTLEMNDSSRDQMDFMYKMTHELQTPVSSIRLAADMLVVPAVVSTPERLQKYVRIIKEEGQRMQSHVENVLNIAKAESKSLCLNLEATPLNDLVHSVAERYHGSIQADCRAQEPLVAADRLHFTNVLHNLFENAIKYSKGTPRVRVKTYDRADTYVVAVQDEGIGIPKEEQRRIFQKFYRAPGTNGSVKGFGLGLSYVQQIAQAHHWALELESEVGKGSEFRLIIPKMT
ncbi:hypothetical protein GCM10027275_40060 [Rhabdobacter roseus]|uniref:histidine kinase n=1 Tax=Rhabdobacter roseus TaxID=1655419 RepID=A0A840TWS3_9BACT|nr:HAMP domain-containing sensor histidine kinase [Rhabdobacter roseus]MBB5285713.1 two-component system phosphate regulon sensor histidine kinase PhoR [Rhabdobacter roseus]